MQDLLDTLFGPLEGLDFEYLYDRYHTGIDFVLYCFVLIFVCRLGLARMFPGEHGEKLGNVLGIVLAISLSAAEHTLGFSLKSFGPIAAGLIILIVALVLYNMMRHVGAGHTAAGATALIVTYFTMRAVLPGFFLWAKSNEWANYLHALLILAVLVALWRFISALLEPKETSALKRMVSKVRGDSGGFVEIPRKREMAEWEVVRKRLNRLTIRGRKESKRIIQMLEGILDIIKDYGDDKRVADHICGALNRLKAREHVLLLELTRARHVDKTLMRFDLSQYRQLKARYKNLSKEQQKECRELFENERKKLGIEKKIEELERENKELTELLARAMIENSVLEEEKNVVCDYSYPIID